MTQAKFKNLFSNFQSKIKFSEIRDPSFQCMQEQSINHGESLSHVHERTTLKIRDGEN